MESIRQRSLLRYALRHTLNLAFATFVAVVYLFFVTLADGWGSRFGNGLGGGIVILVWAVFPTLAVGRRFAMIEARAMAWSEALRIPLLTMMPLVAFLIWAGVGLRSDRPEVRLSDLQFWLLQLAYIGVAFGFFAGVMWLRAWLQVRGLRSPRDQDTPPPL